MPSQFLKENPERALKPAFTAWVISKHGGLEITFYRQVDSASKVPGKWCNQETSIHQPTDSNGLCFTPWQHVIDSTWKYFLKATGMHFLTEEMNVIYSSSTLMVCIRTQVSLRTQPSGQLRPFHSPSNLAACMWVTQLRLFWWFHIPVIPVIS